MSEIINLKEVEHIANLSRLELAEKEKSNFARELSSILEYVGKLNEVDTEGVLPTANVFGLANVWREDEVLESGFSSTDLVKNAPEIKDGFFVVPGVFE